MKIARLAVLLILVFSIKSVGQQLGRVTSGVDLGLGYKEDVWVPSAMYHQELSLNNFPWFRIGWGVRGAGYYANRTDLAPKNTAMSGDSLKFGKITTNTISFLVGANVRIWRFDIGANTDLIAIGFGAKRRGLYSAGKLTNGEGSEFYNTYVSSAPSTLNALPLVLDNQNGQSELFLRYWITDRIGIKLGYVHGRVTYTSSEKLDNGQTRFSHSYGVPYAAISFPLYN
ncbi:hypothetical protein [Dyadobacter sp. CY312]|uniref:hypothetical protein n=1 Tax=Dyadobacter sp. CY312 TaxID=2907303 RepID=UPI001F47F50C|nr:hypothetical protein [Dyadobacter sp. CY312]MCE7039559.1 hypothetical protein [Dyadobacter sp. CY312]